jgi:predicted metalloendopeptidase
MKTKSNTKTKSKSKNKTMKKQYKPVTLKNDYYTFINETWIKSHQKRFTHETNIFIDMQDHVNHDLIHIIKQSKSMKQIYDSFLRTTDPAVKETLFEKIAHIDAFRKDQDSFYPFLAWMKQQGFITPIHYDVEEDPKNNQYYISTLEGGGQGSATSFTLDDKSAYQDPKTKPILIAYFNRLFSTVFGENHNYNVSHIYEREKALIEKSLSVVESENLPRIYHKYTPNQLKTSCGFDLQAFSSALGIKTPSHILLQNTQYIRFTMHQCKTWNDESWRPFWVYQVIKMATHFNHPLFHLKISMLSHFYNIIPDTTVEKRALSFTKLICNTQLNKRYLASYKKIKERNYAEGMIYIIKKVLKDRLKKNPWLHPTTKKHAIEKLDAMHFVVGYNKVFEPDPTLATFSLDNGFKNLIAYNQSRMEITTRLVGKHVPSPSVWLRDNDLNTFDVNAYYNVNRNELILPNAILSAPFTNRKQSAAYNFAQLGTTIGHEMMHAFDSDGYQYNKTGNYEVWWTPEDKKKYKEKQESVKKQYEAFAKRDHYKIPADLNMGENIADISGFLIAEEALTRYLETKKETPEDITKSLGDFYSYYAKQWRSTLQAREMRGKIDNNQHTIAKYRVNCVLSRSKRFHEMYGIQKGDGMYYDTDDVIW